MDRKQLYRLIGVGAASTGHAEKILSAAGALISIAATMTLGFWMAGGVGAAMLVASMGASAVLLFAVPHGPLSQPWPLVGGNLVSAIVGVTCAKLVGDPFIAGPLAVSLAIFAMHYLRCIHPPGGATALVAVVGGPATHALGYQYVLTPVLLNVAVMLLIALAFNYSFAWRRYPAALGVQAPAVPPAVPAPAISIPEAKDFDFALREVGSFLDVSRTDLAKIFRLAHKHATRMSLEDLAVDNCYSDGAPADAMAVRKVLALDGESVRYRIVAGEGEGQDGEMSRAGFMIWQRGEVIYTGGQWQRLLPAGGGR